MAKKTPDYTLDDKALDEARAKLKKMADTQKSKLVWAATGAAAQRVATLAKRAWKAVDDPNTPEQISKKIAVRRSSRVSNRTGNPSYRIGVLGGAKPQNSNLAHWRFVEFGTEKAPAKRIWQKVGESAGSQAFKYFEKRMIRELKKIEKE